MYLRNQCQVFSYHKYGNWVFFFIMNFVDQGILVSLDFQFKECHSIMIK